MALKVEMEKELTGDDFGKIERRRQEDFECNEI